MKFIHLNILIASCSAWLGCAMAVASDGELQFARDIQPLLAKHCLLCHGPDDAQGGLQLHGLEEAITELDSGQYAIIPGNPDESELLKRVAADDPDLRMPPEGEGLSSHEIALLRKWIADGADWQVHWAYRELDDASPPEVKHGRGIRNEIDRYVRAKLEREDVTPSPEADRYTLIKRLYYDLIGLPPEPEAVEAFINDDSQTAYEDLVDQLLESPHFGERWGRHWLDKARYADSDGYEKDNHRPDAWRYRDWVINAINNDMPFDQFTIEQLAGDLLPKAEPLQVLATAFHRQTLTNTEGGTDKEQWRVAAVMDRTETLGTVWLGLSVGCARCHSHKYDQITHREYYQLYAYFNNADEATTEVAKAIHTDSAVLDHHETLQSAIAAREQALADSIDDWLPELKAQAKANTKLSLQDQPLENGSINGPEGVTLDLPKQVLESLLAETLDDAAQHRIIDWYQSQDAELQELRKQLRELADEVMAVRVMSQRTEAPRETHILRRGEYKQPLDRVSTGTLASLPPIRPRSGNQQSDRLDLAQWLVSGENPLVPRVAVNHIWKNLFGSGIVPTMNDFGVRGDPPSHPQLLDHLAKKLIDVEWSRKALIKYIAMSATYRQSSRHRPEMVDQDPNNRLLYRQNRFRVEAEIIRDISLAASGLLSRKIGGPSVFPPIPSGVTDLTYNSSFKWNTSQGEDRYRRGMYTYFKRTAPHPNLITFDCPDSNVTNVDRDRSNTPIAALVTLNNETYVEAAQAMAKLILQDPSVDNDVDRLRLALRRCIIRPPTDAEIEDFASLLNTSREWYSSHPKAAQELIGEQAAAGLSAEENAAWIATLRMILNLDEFITRE